jgi:DNA-binding GntR family transcriptional regulator
MIYRTVGAGPQPPVEPPRSRTDFVLEAIRDAILSGEYRPGQALVEADIAKTLQVSKTPVREALKTLSGSGLVEMAPYRGATVRVVDAEMARAVYDVRALLEPEAVRRAVLAGWDFGMARAAINRIRKVGADQEPSKLLPINRQFHAALTVGCGNPLIIKILDDVSDQTALITIAGWEIEPTWLAEMTEHREILLAAEQGDADHAAELMRAHIMTFADRVIERLPDGH